jgi:hypothetical protein
VACALIYNLDVGNGADDATATGSNTRVRDTTGGLGDLTAAIGGGTLMLLVPSDGGQNPVAGPAQVLYYQITKNFVSDPLNGLIVIDNQMTDTAGLPDGSTVVATGNLALGATPTVSWNACTYPAGYDDFIPSTVSVPAVPADFVGSFNPEVVGTGPGCLAPYNSVGNVNCFEGSAGFCGQGGLLVGDNPQDLTWEQALETLTFSADLSTFSMPFTQTPNLQPARTYMSLGGTLANTICQ